MDSLEQDFKVDQYLWNITDDYLKDRTLEFQTTNGTRSINVTAGVPQGAVLGPDLWNIGYDDLLKTSLPEDI